MLIEMINHCFRSQHNDPRETVRHNGRRQRPLAFEALESRRLLATLGPIPGCIPADPAEIIADSPFVDRANGDFHLQVCSPPIDSSIDFGSAFSGSAPDRGAFEFTTGCSTSVTHLNDGGPGSLREAIICANASPGPDTINLMAGTYTLTIPGKGEDAAATGDLDITDDLVIVGAGSGVTIIDAAGLDRVFHVLSGVTLDISGTTITGGNAPGTNAGDGGGGIRDDGGSVTVTNSIISKNFGHQGGGIYTVGAVTITDSIFSENSGSGAGVFMNFGATVDILNTTISNNAGRSINIGNRSTLTITNSTVSENSGFGIVNDRATLIMTGTTISANGSDGISNSGRTSTITNSTISHNAGKGIFNAGPSTITNSTVTGNDGGGISSTGGTANVRNTIIAGNTAGGNNDVTGAFTSQGHNLIGEVGNATGFTHGVNGDQVGTSTAPIDALLGPLQNNGGPTFTHALLSGSPAIDSGSNAGAAGLTTDQRGAGFDRIVNGTVDIGAVEFEMVATPVQIDIKPGSDRNSINLNSKGMLPVAILSTQRANGELEDFDATSLSALALDALFFGDSRDGYGRVSPVRMALEDVDGDGDLDLILHFSMREIREADALDADSVDAVFTADFNGDGRIDLVGNDSVRIIPPTHSKGKGNK